MYEKNVFVLIFNGFKIKYSSGSSSLSTTQSNLSFTKLNIINLPCLLTKRTMYIILYFEQNFKMF